LLGFERTTDRWKASLLQTSLGRQWRSIRQAIFRALAFNPFVRRFGLFVRLHHPEVMRPRPQGHIYAAVERLFDHRSHAIEAFIEELGPVFGHPSLASLPNSSTNDHEPYWDNEWFTGNDARAAFAIVAVFRPGMIVEIGSGNSTRFFRKAITTFETGSRLISIDPFPRSTVHGIADQVIQKSLLDIELDIFKELERNDILFLDGSHLALNGTDTVHFFLEILPLLKNGVLVHLHDIFLPGEYDAEMTRRGYAEQYMLAATLLNGSDWQVLLPVDWASRRNLLPCYYPLPRGGCSFWMTRDPLTVQFAPAVRE
jgi:hypothetical protein